MAQIIGYSSFRETIAEPRLRTTSKCIKETGLSLERRGKLALLGEPVHSRKVQARHSHEEEQEELRAEGDPET